MPKQKNSLKKINKHETKAVRKGAKKVRMPLNIYPELCTLVTAPPAGSDWLHEIKLDGYRLICFIKNKKVTLFTRSNQNWTAKFPRIVNALQKMNLDNVILDGEVVVMDQHKRSNFQLLQNALGGVNASSGVFTSRNAAKYSSTSMSTKHISKAKHSSIGNASMSTQHISAASSQMQYYVFDLLYYAGYDLQDVVLIQRKEILKKILYPKNKVIQFSDYVLGNGDKVYKKICKLGLEGVVSKLISSHYTQARSRDWLKSKCIQRQEFVVIGFTPPAGQRQYFGALLIAVYSKTKQLIYCGRVGTGFNEKTLLLLWKKMLANKTQYCPLAQRPSGTTHVTWVKPKLIVEVEFTEWTEDGSLRHPSYKGLRNDKSPMKIVKERPLKAAKKHSSKRVNDNPLQIFKNRSLKLVRRRSSVTPKE